MPRLALGTVLGLLALTGCSDASDPAQDAADVAEIRAMHDNPGVVPVSVGRIGYPEIEKYGLFGMGCAFAPGTSIAVTVVAQREHAFMIIDDVLITFAADKGSTELPMQAWSHYDAKDYSLRLEREEGAEAQDGIESLSWPGSVTLTDAQGRAVYSESGKVQCGS